ncbi:alkaline phosphatase family protein [Algoriphagus sp.]|jgi:predicted AlkP superfamily pyrophosphatase or phosphodiesterase|uniref:alkaline phosphatase family protein n=1 Tax=Algoriphagus sp. TaxID=1872435 RepID=UPI00272137D3|nr:ectonucleotide pyrophosphatase/phosphodiesterase [Algoriphagus sp.]MDO8968734.1 ectonucleotide pyrophosphatase/phosphodiesterase [Algoriphagus sp.]MDP3199348.1 ectonucleotide pyrophosphatase/phosphodiesterase [Algoriphagus sp.]
MRRFLLFAVGYAGVLFNLFAQQKEPIVIMISLDGFRYDYVERFQPENLLKFISEGTAAEGLIPSFPSKTFPNHYTIATGMLPENHGLVDNSFYEPFKDQVYNMGNRDIVQDGYWYGGTPIWVLAEENGLKAVSYFFVGSEAPVKGIRPSEYFDYDGNVPNLTRISQVFSWMLLPDTERPSMITLYFSDMDDVGHAYGPSNDEKLKERLDKLDRELGALFEGLKSFDLPITVILVSDHGMADVPKDKLINLDQLTEGINARIVNNGALAHLYLEDPSEKIKVIELLKSRGSNFSIDELSKNENYTDISRFPQRIGDLMIIPEFGYYLADNRGMLRYQNRSAMLKTDVYGEHGFSPKNQEMWGIFYAMGPRIKVGHQIKPFQNIHIYPLLCQLLGLETPAGIDGKKEVLAPVLRD